MHIDCPALTGTCLQTGTVHCEELHTSAAFAAVEGEFRDLYSRSSRANIYGGWEWLHQWWETFRGPFTQLFVLLFRQQNRLIGCAPLIIQRPGGLPLRRLEPMGVMRSDYMDLLIEDGFEDVVLAKFQTHLSQSRSWDLLDLQQLPQDSPTAAYFRTRQEELRCVIREQEVCPYIPLPATWEAYLGGLGKKNRYNIGYYRRLLERDFTLEIRRVGREDLDESMQELFRLHQLRWRKRHLPGALFNPRVRSFHLKVASALLDRNQLDLYRLDLNGKAAALLYCFAENNRGYYYLGGFDPEYFRYSVGTVLTAHAIQQSILRGHSVFDFLRGAESYKYRWNVQESRNFRIEWRRDGLRSQALYRLNEVTRAVERRAKAIAHRLEKN